MFRSYISSRYKPFVQFFSSKDGYFIFRTSLSTHSLIHFNQCQQININNRKRQFNSLNQFRKLSQSTSGKNSSLDQMEDTVDSTIEFPEGMELHQVVNALKKVFPLEFASDWDNVGLLIEPSGVLFVKNIMLTIDLTERVLDEAISKEINMIIAYHPPLFKPFKSLTQQSWKERIAIRCIENRIAVFAPHSALDSIKGGINDWLLTPFICSEVKPIERTYLVPKHMGQYEYNVYFSNSSDEFFKELNKLEACVFKEADSNYNVSCNGENLAKILNLLNNHNLYFKTVTKSPKLPLLDEGMGRTATLQNSISIKEVVEAMKNLLSLNQLRLALSSVHTIDTLISTIAVCAGSGASVLRGVNADIIITGEMSHHEILDAVHTGSTVILCEHSNSERDFLKMLKPIMGSYIKLNIIISELDSDPIQLI
ncbi:NGG1 interacting factor [Blomia tropicalis]|nr:NGG1 interacting factor [Blomia tropicalis]